MSLLSDIESILAAENVPSETGVFKSAPAPATYAVLTPIGDTFECADDAPEEDVQNVALSLYSRGNYMALSKRIAGRCIEAGLTITDRRYVGHEDDTGYHHYEIDVQHFYNWEENDGTDRT